MIYIEDEILKFLQDNDIVKLDDVRDMMEQKRRQDIIAKHEFSIFQDKDGRWKTTIRDNTKKGGKRLIAKKDKRDLEDFIIDYINETEGVCFTDPTIRQLYLPWLKSREAEVASPGTLKRNTQDWNKYYEKDPIVDVPMRKLTKQKLVDWAHKKIKDNDFSKKQYYNMIVIMNKIWGYAEASGSIDDNVWSKVRINRKLLRRDVKKSNETQIYFADEKFKLVSYALERFDTNKKNITALAIPLLFLTGLRIGEVVALKYEDFVGDEILIRRSEVNDFTLNKDDGKVHYAGTKIVDHTKTDAGERSVPCTAGARQIVELIRQASKEYGYYDNGYIFCPNSKRVRSNTIDIKLYEFCEKIGIPKKSAHKIRKTYISTMMNSGIDIDTVCRVAGHTDISTTFNSYIYSLSKNDEQLVKFENMCSEISSLCVNECKSKTS